MNALRYYLFVAAVSACLLCSPRFTAIQPDGFAEYPSGRTYKAVSHDRVVYRVREVKNDPYARFPFWKEALTKRMTDAGYRVIADSTFSIHNRPALLLETAAPLDETDYSYLIAMIVNGDRIVIAEAAGETDLVRKKRGTIIEAIRGITLR